MELRPEQEAEARSRAFALFGSLFLHGPTPHNIPRLRAVPGMLSLLPEHQDHLDESVFDALAAQHHDVLGRQIRPYESVFLNESGLMGGEIAGSVQAWMERSGVPTNTGWATEPDHLGNELLLLSHLEGARADALEDGRSPMVQQLETMEKDFLDGHLLRWMPVFLASIRAARCIDGTTIKGLGLYILAADLALDLVVSMRGALSGGVACWALPVPPATLDNDKAGLRAISQHLSNCSITGGYLLPATLIAMGSNLDLPAGFGSRTDTLENLFHASARYGMQGEVIRGLDKHCHDWTKELKARMSPHLATHVEPWVGQIHKTVLMLAEMQSALDELL